MAGNAGPSGGSQQATSDTGSRASGAGAGREAFAFWEGEAENSLLTHSSESLAVPLACTWAPSLSTSGSPHLPYLCIPLLSRTFSPYPGSTQGSHALKPGKPALTPHPSPHQSSPASVSGAAQGGG